MMRMDREHTREELTAIAQYYETHDATQRDSDEVDVEPGRDAMVSRSVRFTRETMESLKQVARKRKIGVTQLIRQWVIERLAAEQDSTSSVAGNVPVLDLITLHVNFSEPDVTANPGILIDSSFASKRHFSAHHGYRSAYALGPDLVRAIGKKL